MPSDGPLVIGSAGSAGVDVAAVADGRDADNVQLIIDRVHDPIVTDPDAPQPV
jgi:hypothetical protein